VTDFSAKDLLQLVDFERFLFDRMIPFDGEPRGKGAPNPGLANEIRQGLTMLHGLDLRAKTRFLDKTKPRTNGP
jgi:hypothetical protein